MNRPFLRCLAVLVLTALVAPHLIYPDFVIQVLCFALFACSYNLVLGYGGLMSFGHAAYFGSAAYVTAHVVKQWGWSPELGLLSGTLVALVMGAVFGWIAIKRQGVYFAMITLALAQLMYFVAVEVPFTHGDDGIQDVPQGYLFGVVNLANPTILYLFVLTVFVAGFLLIYRTIHSPFGHVLQGIRENQQRAVSLAYDTNRYKLLAFTLSAALSGLAGSTKVIALQMTSLSDIGPQLSGDVVLMTLIGGVGTIFGPVIGAVVVVGLQDVLAQYASVFRIVEGVAFIASVLLLRRGIVGEIDRWRSQLRSLKVRMKRQNRLASRSPKSSDHGAAKPIGQTEVVRPEL